MGYLIAVIIVVLLVGAFVAFLVVSATRKSGPAADGSPGIGRDRTPLGDTSEHADPDSAAHVARPGEGEGRERLGFEGERPRPASERLANRER